MTNPGYYYLSGTPAKIEERLLDPVRLADKWWVQAWHPESPISYYYSSFVCACERIVKTVASVFLYLLSMPLKPLAALIHTIYRKPIPQAHFDERKKYWDKIIFSKDDKDNIIKELIRANIPDTKYTKIFWQIAFREQHILAHGYFADDEEFSSEREAIKNDPSGGPYLFVRQGRLGSEFQPCLFKDITEDNIQAGFKSRLIGEGKEFSGFFSKEIISKCDFLLAINPSCQWDINNSLNEPAVRRRIEACVK